jgi:predicted transcriptional regulator
MSALAIRLDLGARMSSRQIGEVVKASHDNVLKTVRSLMDRGIVSANDTPYVHPQNGQIYTEYLLDFRNTMVVASGYKAKLRAEIIDRWIELETAARAKPAPSVLDPSPPGQTASSSPRSCFGICPRTRRGHEERAAQTLSRPFSGRRKSCD